MKKHLVGKRFFSPPAPSGGALPVGANVTLDPFSFAGGRSGKLTEHVGECVRPPAKLQSPADPLAPTGSAPPEGAGGGRNFYLVLGFLTLLLASVPYLYGVLSTPPGHVYTGFTMNIDDQMVYLSWMRQAQDGHFFQHNQFSIEPQKGVVFNLFFLLLGNLVRVTHLAPILVYHAARVVCGGLLLAAVVRLLRETLAVERARRIAYALVCLSSGTGWLFGGHSMTAGYAQPVDVWQPEAITFLSLYFSPLFVAALALMVVFVTALLVVSERTGQWRDLWPAAIAGALLGNFHSYDVIHLFGVAAAYRIVTDLAHRRLNRNGWLRLILVGLATLPTTGYQYYALRVETVFFERAFVSATWSPAFWWVLLGFGFVLLYAVAALLLPRKASGETNDTAPASFTSADALRLLIVWAIVGIAVSYIPISFQRKMLMGAHIPLCLLGGAAVAAFTARLSGDFPKIAATAAVLITIPSNLLFLQTDMTRLAANVGTTPHRPYLADDEADALKWLHDHTATSDTVLVSPDPFSHLRYPPNNALHPYLSVFVPAYAGNVVYNGHWSETASFGKKVGRAAHFFRAGTTDDERRAFLQENGIRYILYANALGNGPLRAEDGTILRDKDTGQPPYVPVGWPNQGVPAFLRPVYQNKAITVYQVVP